MVAVVALNNANINGAMINAPDGTLPPALPPGATGATVIPAHNVHADEDWSLAGGCPVDAEMKRLGLNRPLDDDLIETLEEIETARNNLLLGEDIYNQPTTKTKPKAPSHQNITTEDIDRIVNSRIQALQQSTPNQSPASSSGQENITRADLQEAIAKSFQETMSRATKTLDNSKKSANKRGENLIIRRFLSELLRGKGNVAPGDDYNYDPIDDITDMAPMEPKIVSQSNTLVSSKDSDESSLEEESLDDPMEIDFVKKKEPKTSVATVECKIKRLKIPAMTLDSGAEPPIITENIVERIGAKIDKSEIHDLKGISTVPAESIGVVRNLPITLAPRLTIIEDFIVMRYHKPTLIFSNQLLKKYRCAVDWATNELKIPLNGKDYIIPVTMHKIKNKLEVNCATTTSECDDLSTPDKISQDPQDLSEDETLKKK
ncbi:hypothetical protein GLOIN_2v1886689 [Rhizophagus clarus]|uniref:Uncharacterized protein n=1 Tax=Rhizophagus clarus TaxID=94130 RepID=A0A8H3QQJ1_9GLOM|nr:hypothetical protein GLOIN_2v1886689 [Rhizophagus clarus]